MKRWIYKRGDTYTCCLKVLGKDVVKEMVTKLVLFIDHFFFKQFTFEQC